jgi:hypothetical protein
MIEPREAVAPRAEDELRRLASEATSGPWQVGDSDDFDWFVAATASKTHRECQVWAGRPVNATATAAYIAAASPDRILALLDRLGRLERAAVAEGHRPVCAFCGGRFPDQHVDAWPGPNCACSIGKGRLPCRIGEALAGENGGTAG